MMKWLTPRRSGTDRDHFAEAMKREISRSVRSSPKPTGGTAGAPTRRPQSAGIIAMLEWFVKRAL